MSKFNSTKKQFVLKKETLTYWFSVKLGKSKKKGEGGNGMKLTDTAEVPLTMQLNSKERGMRIKISHRRYLDMDGYRDGNCTHTRNATKEFLNTGKDKKK